MISRLTTGSIPNPDVLSHISRCEHLSIDWLVSERGKPFLATQTTSDEQTAKAILDLLDDEKWQVTLIGGPRSAAIACTQPAIWVFKSQEIKYTAFELISGPVAAATIDILNSKDKASNECLYLAASQTLLDSISNCEIGTWLIHDSKSAYLRDAVKYKEAQGINALNWSTELGSLTADEQAFLSTYRAIADEQTRDQAKAVVDALQKKTNSQ